MVEWEPGPARGGDSEAAAEVRVVRAVPVAIDGPDAQEAALAGRLVARGRLLFPAAATTTMPASSARAMAWLNSGGVPPTSGTSLPSERLMTSTWCATA